jgi:protein tyrosine phosphatase (PTP) superfamily phosphohydrolase (DUF442 family)
MKPISLLGVTLIVTTVTIQLVAATPDTVQSPERIESKTLPNAFRLTDKVYSGGQPQGEAAFKELKELGVKTVISVDGARPNVSLAKKYGLRYVHLPHGYDGIPDERLLELTKAVHDLQGPFYIHCHHGKHRSPAAAAAVCVSAGYMNNDEALHVLGAAGTSKGYRGLFQTVTKARRIDAKTLRSANVEFRETVDVPPMADAMIEIEHTHDHLKLIASSGWKATAEHPDIDPPHEALLLREHFTELLRTEAVAKQPEEFRRILRQSESHANKLEIALRGGLTDVRELTGFFDAITADCTACHQKFRDVPLDEKAPQR